jgi:two-component system, chemotaxis family, sensor kinase CheA
MVLLLVESGQNERWALAVDKIHDQRQVVIKGLETNYGHVPGVAAATILGDGKIALIIDPDETAQRKRRPSAPASAFIPEEA